MLQVGQGQKLNPVDLSIVDLIRLLVIESIGQGPRRSVRAIPCLARALVPQPLCYALSQASSGRKGSAYSPCTTPAPTSSRRSLFGQVGPADSNPGQYSPLAAHHSPRTTHQLTTLHSPLTTRHAPLPCSTPKLQACARALPPARRAAHVPPLAQQLFIPHPPLSHRPRPPPAPLASPHASSHLLRSTLATP